MIYDSDSDFIEYATGNKMEKSNGKVLKVSIHKSLTNLNP
jgi:hypothetical protein